MAVRFSDMQGKSHWMAISPYFLRTSPKKTSPAAARRRGAFILIYAKEAGGGRGRSRRGRFGGTGLSLRGGSLQGLLPQRHLSPVVGGRRLGKFSQGEVWRGLPLRKRRPLQGLLPQRHLSFARRWAGKRYNSYMGISVIFGAGNGKST